MKGGKTWAGKYILKLGYHRLVLLSERMLFITMQFINRNAQSHTKKMYGKKRHQFAHRKSSPWFSSEIAFSGTRTSNGFSNCFKGCSQSTLPVWVIFITSKSCFPPSSVSHVQPWKWMLFCQRRGAVQAVVKSSSLKLAFKSTQLHTAGTSPPS